MRIYWGRVAWTLAMSAAAVAGALTVLNHLSDEGDAHPSCNVAEADEVCHPEPSDALTFHVSSGTDQGDSFTLEPCVVEDANGCYWDGNERGNKTGVSWWVEPNGTIHWVDSVR